MQQVHLRYSIMNTNCGHLNGGSNTKQYKQFKYTACAINIKLLLLT